MRLFLVPVLLSFLVGLAGCGGGGQPDAYPVEGTVTFRGQPVAEAHVRFIPEEGPPAEGITDESGSFTLRTFEPGDGAVAGPHTVTVSKTVVVDPDPNAAYPAMRSVLPDRYARVGASPLVAEVTADGENQFAFELEP